LPTEAEQAQLDAKLASMTEEDMEALNLEAMAERRRASEAIDKLMEQAKRGQAVKLNVLLTRALAGFVWQLTEQNTHMGTLLDQAAEALDESEKKKKKKLWTK